MKTLRTLQNYFAETLKDAIEDSGKSQREIAEATRTGPATVILSGISSGLESSVYAIIAICASLGTPRRRCATC